MPRAIFVRRMPAVALLLCVALLALMGVVPGAAYAATTPSPTPSASGSGSGAKAKPPTVTFGIGPSNGKQLDGRPYFSYASSPGQVINDHFELVNISSRPVNLLVYGAAGLTNADGTLGYEPDAAKRTGDGLWLRTPLSNGQPFFTVPARQTLTLPFQLDIPANASPGDHTAGIAVGLVTSIVGGSTKNLKFEQRVVAKVYVRVSGTATPKLEVTNVYASYSGTLNPFGTGDAELTYTVSNTGNVDLGAKQKISLSGLFGSDGTPRFGSGAGTSVTPILSDLIPGSSTTVSVTFHDVLPLVLLNASVHLTPMALLGSVDGTLKDVSGSTRVWAIPWAFLVLVLLLVGIGYVVHRYRKHVLATRTAPSHRRSKVAPLPNP